MNSEDRKHFLNNIRKLRAANKRAGKKTGLGKKEAYLYNWFPANFAPGYVSPSNQPRAPKNIALPKRLQAPNKGRAPVYTNFGPAKATKAIQPPNIGYMRVAPVRKTPPKASPPKPVVHHPRIFPKASPNKGIYISTPQQRVRINGKLVTGYSPKSTLIAKLKSKGIDVDPNLSVKQIADFIRQYAKLGGPVKNVQPRTRAELLRNIEKAATKTSKHRPVEIASPGQKRAGQLRAVGRNAWMLKMSKMWVPLQKRTKNQLIAYGNKHKIGGLKKYKKKDILISEINSKLNRDVRSILRNVVMKANSPNAINKLSLKHILDRLVKEYGWHASKNVNRAKIQAIFEDEYKNYIKA